MTTLHLCVGRCAYAMASVVNAHGGPSCCIHLALRARNSRHQRL